MIAKDPENGVRNASIQRFMVVASDRMNINIDAGRHLETYLEKARKKGEADQAFRWGVSGADDARAKVRRLADAGVNVIKLIDQDQMTLDELSAVVGEAHQRGLPVVAHAHRPEEIRRGLGPAWIASSTRASPARPSTPRRSSTPSASGRRR